MVTTSISDPGAWNCGGQGCGANTCADCAKPVKPAPTELVIVIPGDPVAQARPRFSKSGHAYTDAKSRSWKGTAQVHYLEAMAKAGLKEPAFAGPVEVNILAVFACPKSHTRKKGPPLPRRPFTGRRDWDNIGKAVCDAGNGVLWTDDAQVWRGVVERIYGAQGEAARVVVDVKPYPGSGPLVNPAEA